MDPFRVTGTVFILLLTGFSRGSLGFELSGKILEKGSKDPLVGASLYFERTGSLNPNPLETTLPPASASNPEESKTPATIISHVPPSFSAETDLNGFYQVSIPEGVYRVTVAGEGFEKLRLTSFPMGKDAQKDFYLIREGFSLPEIVVSASKESKTAVSHESVSKDELRSVPGTAGDVLRALQSLPGVAVAGDFSGQLIVRGGGPEDNLYLMDRIPLAFPFHFGGLLSTVNSDLIKNVDFSAGGFGPAYGNYWGGVVDITQRDPRRDRWGGRAEVNMLLSEGLLEGPITSNSSLALAGRRSYLELFSGLFTGGSLTVIPSFGDYQFKYSYDYSKQTHWDFQAFGSNDRIGLTIKPDSDLAKQDPAYAGEFSFHNTFDSQGFNYRRYCDGQNTFLATLYHTNFYFGTHMGKDLHLDINFEDYGGRFDWLYDFDESNHLRLGMEVDHTITGNNSYFVDIPGEGQPNFDLTTSPRISASETTLADNFGFYVEQKFKWFDKKLEVTAGLRADYLAYNSHFTWGPRLAAAFLLTPETTLRGSFGYYYQLPWQGPYLDPSFGNPNLFSERAVSSILGFEQKLRDGFYFRVEGYNKDLTNVVVSDPLTHYSNIGTGYSRGIEFFIRRAPTERFFGWISYAFSDSLRHNSPGDTHVYDYDQPHIATLVASYKINPGWDVGFKWRYSSGQPTTPILGAVFDSLNNRYLPFYGPLNSSRLPDYHRLDFSTSLTTVYDTWQWRFYLEILNVYNHPNVFTYDYNSDYTQRRELLQLPFLPYIGFEMKY